MKNPSPADFGNLSGKSDMEIRKKKNKNNKIISVLRRTFEEFLFTNSIITY